MRPVFIGIGAQKCASTWLHRILSEHPQVGISERKEINFFSCYFDHGFQWYERFFAETGSAPVIGEISSSYFCEPAVPERIAHYIPNAKLLLSLREPVQRALSNHRHEVRASHIDGPDFSFEAGLQNNPMYVTQGLYATHLKNWLRYFPMEQILVLLMDDVEADPAEASRTVFRFLGVNEGFVPAGVMARHNYSFATKSSAFAQAKDAVYALTRFPGLKWIWNAAAGLGFRGLYRAMNEVPSSAVIPPPRDETLQQLREIFEPEIREIEVMISRSLTSWLERRV